MDYKHMNGEFASALECWAVVMMLDEIRHTMASEPKIVWLKEEFELQAEGAKITGNFGLLQQFCTFEF